MHFCYDEVVAIAAIIPGLPLAITWARMKIRAIRGGKNEM